MTRAARYVALAAAVIAVALVGVTSAASMKTAVAVTPSPKTLDALHDRIGTWLLANGLDGFHVAEVMAFSENDYVAVADAKGKDAFELLVSPASGWIMEEPPSMMWNTKYGMMGGAAGSWMGGGMMGGGMMGGGWRGWYSDGATRVTSVAQAARIANRWLARVRSDEKPETDGRAFPGYFTLDTIVGGKTAGMLSVNARTGAVWYHGWHGKFLAEQEY